nr:unnamed protein product [Callosobruchus analis]
MATTPSTIVVFTEDKVNFPTKYVMVVMKQLFQYGVKNMETSGDKVFISLSYSPRATTLKRKFGNLPVRYMRVKIDKEQDFKILEKVVRRYRFNLLDEQVEDLDNSRVEGGGKRKLYLQPPTLLVDDDDDDDDYDADADADANANTNEVVKVNRPGSRHQVKRNRGGGEAAAAAAAAAESASTSATASVAAAAAAAAAPRMDNSPSSNDDAVVVNLVDDFDFTLEK